MTGTYWVVVEHRLKGEPDRAYRTAPIEVLADSDTEATLIAAQLATAHRCAVYVDSDGREVGVMPTRTTITDLVL